MGTIIQFPIRQRDPRPTVLPLWWWGAVVLGVATGMRLLLWWLP
jgi:demethoxyubiquinone hydroxylase (CLK1/Coq7/Cat5 family)